MHKQLVSAEAMRKLQPKIDELKKKYAGDKERQQQEMMRLYQTEKVNPFGGCLPMLVQLPVWFALYAVLRNSFDLYRAPFIGPLWTDLTLKDPTFIIPVLLVISQIITTKLQPQPMMDATQAKVMTFVMPVFFGAVMLAYPLGLTLYIFTNNVLSVMQQYGLRRYLERKGTITPIARRPALERRK
jgi:YidC/Oxa1 family membrane protein insertase